MTETKNEPARDDMERVTAWRGIAQAWEALGDLAGPGFRALVEIDGSGRVGAEIQLRQEHGDGWDTIAQGEGENIEEAVAALEESNASSPTPPSSPSSRAPATEGERRFWCAGCQQHYTGTPPKYFCTHCDGLGRRLASRAAAEAMSA